MFAFFTEAFEVGNTATDAELENFVQKVKAEHPSLKDLKPEHWQELAKVAVFQNLVADMKRKIDLAGIDWLEEKAKFLSQYKSSSTKRTYSFFLKAFEEWTEKNKIDKLNLTYRQADDYVRDMNSSVEGLTPATIRLNVSCISSFYSFLSRRYDKINNAFRGTKSRPQRKNVKELLVPTTEEVELIIQRLPSKLAVAVAIMSYRGLRVGALPTLKLYGGRYRGVSKGKNLTENEVDGITLPTRCEELIKRQQQPLNKLFENISANALAHNIAYYVAKLHREGKISHVYSCHDFRHFFARTEYEKTKDIHRISKLLNHSNISVTEAYLRSLNIVLGPACNVDATETSTSICTALMVLKERQC
jgi:site-specific recombinase XerD